MNALAKLLDLSKEEKTENGLLYTPTEIASNLALGSRPSRCFRNAEWTFWSFLRMPDSDIPRGRSRLFFSSVQEPPTILAEASRTSSAASGNVKLLPFPAPAFSPTWNNG